MVTTSLNMGIIADSGFTSFMTKTDEEESGIMQRHMLECTLAHTRSILGNIDAAAAADRD